MAKGASERFMRTVARIEGHRKYVWSALGKGPGGFAEAASTHIPGKRTACRNGKHAGKMKPGNPDNAGDCLKRQLPAEVALDVPEGFGAYAHVGPE